MLTLAIGDIHGSTGALRVLMRAVGKTVPTRKTTLVTLGDYVDKGEDTAGTLDWLIAWQHRGELVALRGNHDQMMLDARDDRDAFDVWMNCGGDATLRSYGLPLNLDAVARIPAAHWKFLESTALIHESGDHFFVHGSVEPMVALDEQDPDVLLWEKCYSAEPHVSGKTMVCGHASQKDGLVLDMGHAICIDTFAWGGGWLTAMDPATGRYWQANLAGQTLTTERVRM